MHVSTAGLEGSDQGGAAAGLKDYRVDVHKDGTISVVPTAPGEAVAGTVNAALVKYYLSDDFAAMTKDARQQNRGYLKKWRATRGDKKLRGKHEHVQG